MDDNIKYLKVTPKDENAVIKLHALLYGDDNTKMAEEVDKKVHSALKNKMLWVVKVGGKVVGYVLCELFNEKQKYFPNSIFIDGLFVLEEYRKKGIGKNLVELVLKNKFPKQYTYFSVTHDPESKHLTKFYKSLGFSENGVTDAGNIKLVKAINKNKIYIDPRHAEHSFDLPFWRDNKKLWALKVPAEEMSLKEFMWILDVPFWEDKHGNIVFTPREVMNDPNNYPEHRDKINNADTSHPIDIMKNKKGKWLTLDGLHRLVKLIMEGKKTVRVRKIPQNLINLTARDE